LNNVQVLGSKQSGELENIGTLPTNAEENNKTVVNPFVIAPPPILTNTTSNLINQTSQILVNNNTTVPNKLTNLTSSAANSSDSSTTKTDIFKLTEKIERPASPPKVCFVGTVKSILSSLTERVTYLTGLNKLESNQFLANLMTIAKYLGGAEAKVQAGKFTSDDLEQLKTTKFEPILNITDESEFDFESYYRNIKDLIFEDGKKRDTPRVNLKNEQRLVDYERYQQYFTSSFPDTGVCLPIRPEIFEVLDILSKDPTNNSTELDCNSKESDSHTVKPVDYSIHGVTIAFWAKVDNSKVPVNPINKTDTTGIPIIQGFNGNDRVLDVKYKPGVDVNEMIVEVELLKEKVPFKIPVKHPDNVFFLISIVPVDDNFKIVLVFRWACSDERRELIRNVATTEIEKITFNLMKPTTQHGPYVYKDFVYTREGEDQILKQTTQTILSKDMVSILCPTIPNCSYATEEKCILCDTGFLLHDGKCVSSCPDGTFINKDTLSCDNCDSTCITCTALNKCIECKNNLLLSVTDTEAKCVNSCPIGMVPDVDNKKCTDCSENCMNCKTVDVCDQCNPDKYLLNGKCTETCPDGTFKDSNPKQCKNCMDNCAKCDTFEKCEECKSGTFLKDGVCVSRCDDGYFSANGTCNSCVVNCKKCSNPTQCQECNESFLLDDSTKLCKNKCEPGQVEVKGTCVNCPDSDDCRLCNPNNLAVCLVCCDEKVLKNGKCVNTCDDGYYVDTQKNECVKCSNNCKTCTEDKCLICNENSYLLDDKTCVPKCPDSYVISGSVCIKCTNPSCLECNPDNLDTCVSCHVNQVLKEGTCVDKCDNGYFLENRECKKCLNGCEICNDALAVKNVLIICSKKVMSAY